MTGERLSTGIEGLDEILEGGLIPRRTYLVRGEPGRGKTTLGLHFLTASGSSEGNCALFVGFQESEEQLRANAASIGMDTTGVRVVSLAPKEEFFAEQQSYDVFSAGDVEQEPIVRAIVDAVEEVCPGRVFVDSLTQLRFLSPDPFQYRKQVLSFLRFLTDRGATVIFSSEATEEVPDSDLQFMSDGVINLESRVSGAVLRVSKFRGSNFRRGMHHTRIAGDGMRVFPHMIPPRSTLAEGPLYQFASGVDGLDQMLHGGLESGTISLITGPSGAGKSTLATSVACAAAANDRRVAMFLFEEDVVTLRHRAGNLGIPIESASIDGLLLEQVEPMRYLIDEFSMHVRDYVQNSGVELVVIDSISGFELSLEGEGIQQRLHAFAKSLARLGITVLLVNETEMITELRQVSERDISYLADNVIFVRYATEGGANRKVIGVLKKRLSGFDGQARALEIEAGSVTTGDVVR